MNQFVKNALMVQEDSFLIRTTDGQVHGGKFNAFLDDEWIILRDANGSPTFVAIVHIASITQQ